MAINLWQISSISWGFIIPNSVSIRPSIFSCNSVACYVSSTFNLALTKFEIASPLLLNFLVAVLSSWLKLITLSFFNCILSFATAWKRESFIFSFLVLLRCFDCMIDEDEFVPVDAKMLFFSWLYTQIFEISFKVKFKFYIYHLYQNLACGALFQFNNHDLLENVDWN